MENNNLIQTKRKLTISLLATIKNLAEKESHQISQNVLNKSFNLNEILLKKIQFIDSHINNGEINNQLDYQESDFELIYTIHQIHQKIDSYPQNINTIYVKIEDVEEQLKKAYQLIHSFPVDFGLNYRISINNICAIQIDRYQILHLISLINIDLVNQTNKAKSIKQFVELSDNY